MDPRLSRHMAGVEQYRQTLHLLQGVWDNLALLGHLSGTGADMSATRHAFQSLSSELLDNLSAQTLQKTLLEMQAKAQVAVDIMVRNLFERTADIGFLASDDEIRRFLQQYPELQRQAKGYSDEADSSRKTLQQQRTTLQHRFREYVAKYSVYSNIILLDVSGNVLLQLNEDTPVERSQDPLIREALETSAGYVERFRQSDLVPDGQEGLIYAYRVTDGDTPLGVLCLCFRFENETEGIFRNLCEAGDMTVLMLLDGQGRVIASSDRYHVPVGAPMELALEEDGRVVRFAGREYLASTRRTQGYQGYQGPGWYGHAMAPVQHAFEQDASEMLQRVSHEVLANVRGNPTIFPEALRTIPMQAETIQSELNRSVWNGNVRLGARQADNSSFSKVLLWEISNTGMKTKEVFEKSITDLHETVVSAILRDSRFLASLAVDIMDRNLYERANDCRWWALDTTLGAYLEGRGGDTATVTDILRHINSLYTVYHNLVLFDASGRVVAVSNPDYGTMVGSSLGEEWVRQTLSLSNSASYHVSPFNPTPLYQGRHTYVYGAAVRSADGARAVGGIGIVFDSAPQFSAMLRDALPRNEKGEVKPGCIGIFADAQQRVISASDRYKPGERLALDPIFFSPPPEGVANIVALDGQYYAVGARASGGYREYPGVGALAIILIPLGQVGTSTLRHRGPERQLRQRGRVGGDAVDIATFTIGGNWFGLRSEHVAEAIDLQNATGVPGAPDYVVGYLMWQGKPIAVVDIGRLLSPEAPAQGRDVVVVHSGNDQEVFGILVDELNEIPEVPQERIEVISTSFAGDNVLVEAMVRPEQSNEPILPVLSPERIRARIISRLRVAERGDKGEAERPRQVATTGVRTLNAA